MDDDSAPIERLQALVNLHHLFFKPPEPGEMVEITGDVARQMQQILRWSGHYEGPLNGEYDLATRAALSALIGNENLEERFNEAEGLISTQVVEVLQRKFGR